MNGDPKALRLTLLAWYDIHARDLPWRILPAARDEGVLPDPYRIWLSEIMLQQTTITTVKPYFTKFLAAFPTIDDMAHAPLDAILAQWAGLGYYARARNLHACAQAISAVGGFPRSPEGLSQFVGIGPYTSAAIASIAFDYPSVPVDGNVERVLSRLLRIADALPASKPIFRDAAIQFEDSHRPGDFAQALMDLGSTLCTPRKPACGQCPWQLDCLSAHQSDVENFPAKTPKKIKPIRHGVAFVHVNEAGILVARRPEKGLLGGMLEVPGTDWQNTPWVLADACTRAPVTNATWREVGAVRHIFTHFDLRLQVYAASDGEDAITNTNTGTGTSAGTGAGNTTWRLALADIDHAALPSVMMKVIKAGLAKRPMM